MKKSIASILCVLSFVAFAAPTVSYQTATNIAKKVIDQTLSDALDAKRALTNNTCSAPEFGEWSIPKSHETLLSEPQPKWNGVQGIEWIWRAGSYMYQATGTKNSTELDFYDPNPEVYDHFTSKRAAVCSSNDTFVTWTPMTNAIARLAPIDASDPTFSNAVLAVGLNIDTNSVAVLNEIASTFGGFPIGGTATTVGGLLAALAAAIAWLRKRTAHLESDGTADAEFATDLFEKQAAKDAIDAEIIEKGTAPDAHLEAPTDERLKLILADNSVAYDSAKALPYKLTSVIGDRVVATMTLNAASTDITLPTIAVNDTTVKDFILDVTNAYAVEGVATDAGINIPRTDFKLVTRDGESLTEVTTVKAGKSAFLCFTQKAPVVVDGTTYPCWCVIQLPFGDPS